MSIRRLGSIILEFSYYIHKNLRQQKVDKVLKKKNLPIEEKSELNSEKLFERFYFP